MFLFFGGALAHGQVDGSLLWGDGDLLDVLSPLSLEEKLVLLFLLHILLLLKEGGHTIFKTCLFIFIYSFLAIPHSIEKKPKKHPIINRNTNLQNSI